MNTSSPSDADMTSDQRRALDLATRAAKRAVRRRFRVISLTKDAYIKSEREADRRDRGLACVLRDLRSMIRLAYAWATREYGQVPWRSIVFIVAAIIYFVNPVDLIPDVLTGIGFVDDAAVITAVVRSVTDELAAFRSWEAASSRSTPDVDDAVDGTSVRELWPQTHAAA